MKLLNRLLKVEFEELTTPPKGGNRLATSGRLLVAWRHWDYISDLESGKQYHLAFYHPDYGWRACRWDEKCDKPEDIIPVLETAIWVVTLDNKLVYVSAGDEVRAKMLASAEGSILLLYADADNLWIREKSEDAVMQFRLQKNGLMIVGKKYIPPLADLMYPLADGAWMIRQEHVHGYVIRSSSLEETICKGKSTVFHHPPFLVRKGEDYYYCTEDPRLGWEKTPIGVEDDDGEVSFFVKQHGVCYAAINRHHDKSKIVLYSFSGKSDRDAECMLEIPVYLHPDQFAMYNGLVCIADREPLIISERKDVPPNHGFLVWNPRSNAFGKDIPQFPIMHARYVIPRNLQVPKAWLDRDKERHKDM